MDLTTIPPDRLMLLDTATLFRGSHEREAGCKHCALELAYEVVTGRYGDTSPPGCTELFAILPMLNDGPWPNNAHRTAALRLYIKQMLMLDPADDDRRFFAVIDYIYRSALPDMCHALGFSKRESEFRGLAPIYDRSALAAVAVLTEDWCFYVSTQRPLPDMVLNGLGLWLDLRAGPDVVAYYNAWERLRYYNAWERLCRAVLDRVCSATTVPHD